MDTFTFASAALVVALLAPWIIGFLYGSGFADAVPVLRLLAPVLVAAAMRQLLLTAINAAGRVKVTRPRSHR